MAQTPKERLEYLRGEIVAERISYAEVAELQGLADHIEPGDTLLLEWAGKPENEGATYIADLYKDGKHVDRTSLDEMSFALAEELFKEFGHPMEDGMTIEINRE